MILPSTEILSAVNFPPHTAKEVKRNHIRNILLIKSPLARIVLLLFFPPFYVFLQFIVRAQLLIFRDVRFIGFHFLATQGHNRSLNCQVNLSILFIVGIIWNIPMTAFSKRKPCTFVCTHVLRTLGSLCQYNSSALSGNRYVFACKTDFIHAG